MLPENYFDFYDLQPRFYLDAEELRARYLEISREYHPDQYALADEATQAQVQAISVYNNRAYQTLSQFDSRLEYILQTHGMTDGDDKAADGEFLASIMSLNELLMELEFDADTQTYSKAKQELNKHERELTEALKPLCEQFDAQNGENAGEILQKIKKVYKKTRYLLRISERLHTFATAYEK